MQVKICVKGLTTLHTLFTQSCFTMQNFTHVKYGMVRMHLKRGEKNVKREKKDIFQSHFFIGFFTCIPMVV